MIAAISDSAEQPRAALLAVDPSRLSQPVPDEQMRGLLPTLGHALVQIVSAHTAYHAGQLAAWRRAIGRPPVGVFI